MSEIFPHIERWKAGFQVVYAVRAERKGESAFKIFTAKLFYRVIYRITDVNIPVDTGDFRLMDRRVVDSLKAMREHNRVSGVIEHLDRIEEYVTATPEERFSFRMGHFALVQESLVAIREIVQSLEAEVVALKADKC